MVFEGLGGSDFGTAVAELGEVLELLPNETGVALVMHLWMFDRGGACGYLATRKPAENFPSLSRNFRGPNSEQKF